MQIPFHRPLIGTEEEEAVLRVLRSGWLTTGPETRAFEDEFATYRNSPLAIGMSSCTAGLHLIFAALKLPMDAEVITTPLTFAATVHVLVHNGLQPVLADVLPETGCLDPASVARCITPNTAAVLAVHYGGHLCAMPELQEICQQHGLYLIEDCAHAIETTDATGRAAGTFGIASSFSFYPNKNMTSAEGGMVLTEDPVIAHLVQLMRSQGVQAATPVEGMVGFLPYDVRLPGFKMGMTDVQAALGRVQLCQIEGWWPHREALAKRYAEILSRFGARLVGPIEGTRSAWHLAVAVLPEGTTREQTEALMQRIQQRGIGLSWHYRPIHRLRAYKHLAAPDELPVCESLAARNFSLPLYPALSDAEMDCVCKVLEEELGV